MRSVPGTVVVAALANVILFAGGAPGVVKVIYMQNPDRNKITNKNGVKCK